MLKNMQEVLEYGFDVLNKVYFGNNLPQAVITIMSSPKTYEHFTVGKVWKAEDSHYNEIYISAEHLDGNGGQAAKNSPHCLLFQFIKFF